MILAEFSQAIYSIPVESGGVVWKKVMVVDLGGRHRDVSLVFIEIWHE